MGHWTPAVVEPKELYFNVHLQSNGFSTLCGLVLMSICGEGGFIPLAANALLLNVKE